jgi:aspartyl aminopeptidase
MEQRGSGLNELLLAELEGHGIDPKQDVLGHDLCLYDTQPSSLGGREEELIFAPRLDNLASCHAAITALLRAVGPRAATRVVVLYDHEEVGSQSAAGARSSFLFNVLDRLATSMHATEQAYARALGRSLMVSCDMAHAVHPNYPEKHDREHRPKLGGGPVIKRNANQSYATDGPGTALFSEACQAANIEPQHFVSRNDMGCGSTIGPISASLLSVRTVDVGNPMLSMHSCREMAGAADVAPMISTLAHLLTEAELPEPAA